MLGAPRGPLLRTVVSAGGVLDAQEQVVAHQCNCPSRGARGLAVDSIGAVLHVLRGFGTDFDETQGAVFRHSLSGSERGAAEELHAVLTCQRWA